MTEFYNEPAFQRAAADATQRANRTGDRQRIFRRAGEYFVGPAVNGYVGIHVAFVEPDAELIRIKAA